MKKLMMIAAMMLMSIGAFAQGKFAIGADFNYLIDSDASRMAPGVKLQYEFVESFRAEAIFKYYPKKDLNTAWNAGLNIQYVIPVAEGFNVYPMVGAGVLGQSIDLSEIGHGSESTTAFIFGGGAGAEYFIGQNLKLYFDAVYQYGKKDGIKVINNPVLSLGIAYAF